MIKVTRLNSSELVINCDLIEFVEAIPETMVSLITGKKIMVTENVEEIINRVAEFKKRAGNPVLSPDSPAFKLGKSNG
jgi:flagellar protein FlbD